MLNEYKESRRQSSLRAQPDQVLILTLPRLIFAKKILVRMVPFVNWYLLYIDLLGARAKNRKLCSFSFFNGITDLRIISRLENSISSYTWASVLDVVWCLVGPFGMEVA